MLTMWIAVSLFFDRIGDDERGAGIAEYALILVLVAVVAIAALNGLSDSIGNAIGRIVTAIDGTPPPPAP